MHNPLQYIEIDGKRRELLITPSLYKICHEKGWKIEGLTSSDIFPAYCKLLYAAAVNAYEVRRFDNPKEEFDLTLLDLEVWAALNRKEMEGLIVISCELLSGQSVKDLVEEQKKKTRASTLSETTNQSKSFSWGRVFQRRKQD